MNLYTNTLRLNDLGHKLALILPLEQHPHSLWHLLELRLPHRLERTQLPLQDPVTQVRVCLGEFT